MMVIVAITQCCGIFQYVAIWSAKKVEARPWGILLMLSVITTVFSALPDKQSKDVHHSFGEVEWVTIFFFVGLFIVVSGIEHAGLLEILANWVLGLTGGDMTVTAIAIIWVYSVASALWTTSLS